MKICTKCGALNEDDAVSCRKCGAHTFRPAAAAAPAPEAANASTAAQPAQAETAAKKKGSVTNLLKNPDAAEELSWPAALLILVLHAVALALWYCFAFAGVLGSLVGGFMGDLEFHLYGRMGTEIFYLVELLNGSGSFWYSLLGGIVVTLLIWVLFALTVPVCRGSWKNFRGGVWRQAAGALLLPALLVLVSVCFCRVPVVSLIVLAAALVTVLVELAARLHEVKFWWRFLYILAAGMLIVTVFLCMEMLCLGHMVIDTVSKMYGHPYHD